MSDWFIAAILVGMRIYILSKEEFLNANVSSGCKNYFILVIKIISIAYLSFGLFTE